MRISHRYRFVFFARPKTGSSSVRQFLNPWSDVLAVSDYRERTPENPFYPHMRPVEAREHFRARGWDFDGYTKFVCARNPWARIVSLYRHVREEDARTPRFPEWVATIAPDGAGGGGEDWQRWRRYGAYSLASYANDQDGRPLVDAVLPLETLEEELRPFLAALGLPGVAERALEHRNDRSNGESYVGYYDDEARARVAAFHRDEIERFGYVFGADLARRA
jgi:hypothetical protein